MTLFNLAVYSQAVQAMEGHASQRQEKLQVELHQATEQHMAWQDLSHFLERGWPLHILSLLQDKGTLLQGLHTSTDESTTLLTDIRRVATAQAEVVRRRYPGLLEDACKRARLVIDPESRHPRYSFDGRFFYLDVDDRQGIARLRDNEGPLDKLPADIDAVIQAIQREHNRVFGRPFDGAKFLTKLRQQYAAILQKSGERDGTSVPIRAITSRLGKNEKGFRTDEFLIDLTRLVERGPLDHNGRRLDLQQTKDTNQGMLLHGAAGGGYIGFVVFRKV